MGLTRADLLKDSRPIVSLDVPALGGMVHLRQLSGAEVTRVYEGERPHAAIAADIVALSLCDESGMRLMTEPDDGRAFYAAHPLAVLQPIVDKAMEINGMTKGAVEAARKE